MADIAYAPNKASSRAGPSNPITMLGEVPSMGIPINNNTNIEIGKVPLKNTFIVVEE